MEFLRDKGQFITHGTASQMNISAFTSASLALMSHKGTKDGPRQTPVQM